VIQAKALFDFESGGPGELTFYANELLNIVRQVRFLSLFHVLSSIDLPVARIVTQYTQYSFQMICRQTNLRFVIMWTGPFMDW